MTARDLTELREIISAYTDTPRTEQEIIDHMASIGEDRHLIKNLLLRMTADKSLAFAPGSLGKRLTTTAHAKAMAAHEGEDA